MEQMEMESSGSNYYMTHKKKMMKFFKTITKRSTKTINTKFNDKLDAQIMDDIKMEYEKLLPHIPYIGGIEPWTKQLLLTTIFLSVYKKLSTLGNSAEEAWEVCNTIMEVQLNSIPRLVRKIIKRSVFSKKQMRTYKRQSLISQNRFYPQGDVFDFIEGDNISYDYGIDIIECAKVKFLKEQQAMEFMPYVCLIDKLWAEIFEYSLIRKGTIADGCDICDFRLRKDGPVKVESPVWKNKWIN